MGASDGCGASVGDVVYFLVGLEVVKTVGAEETVCVRVGEDEKEGEDEGTSVVVV